MALWELKRVAVQNRTYPTQLEAWIRLHCTNRPIQADGSDIFLAMALIISCGDAAPSRLLPSTALRGTKNVPGAVKITSNLRAARACGLEVRGLPQEGWRSVCVLGEREALVSLHEIVPRVARTFRSLKCMRSQKGPSPAAQPDSEK